MQISPSTMCNGGTTLYNYLVERSKIQNAPTTSCTMNLPEMASQYSKAGHLNQSFQFDSTTPLKKLSAYTSHKTLGVYKNPDGNSTAAFRVLKAKNATHTKTTSRSPLSHTDAWAYYHAIYLQSIVYPLPSDSLQCSQYQHLQKQVKQAIIPKCVTITTFKMQ